MTTTTSHESALAFTVDELLEEELLPLGRSATYQAIERGEIPSIRIGRRILIPKALLAEMFGAPQQAESE